MKKVVQLLIVCALIVVVVVALAQRNQGTEDTSTVTPSISAAASTYILGHMIEQVGGDLVDVIDIVPVGVDSHDFEPNPRDITRLYNTDLFVYNGAGIDAWAERIADEIQLNGATVVEMSSKLDLMQRDDGEGVDPHVWLDPMKVSEEIEVIRIELSSLDPEHKKEYARNAEEFTAQLRQLDEQFTSQLAQCESRNIVVAHDAFTYLGNAYDINIIPIAGLSPESEPSPKRLSEIATRAREKNVTTVFFESFASPRLSETIATEIGASTAVLQTIEGLTQDQKNAGEGYISLMEQNLHNLKAAMNCQ